MKNSRLFQILYLLMEHGEMTAGQLAERMEVSRRTIYRDLDALSAAGIPVYTQQGNGGGIHLMDQFLLNRSLLGDEEQEQILTALQSLEAVGAADSARVITQLSGLFQKKTVEWLEIDFESWGSKKTEKEYFELCKRAILGRRLMSFQYYNSSGIQKYRVIEPYRLCFKSGTWYVSGYCRERRDYRLFRLGRMVDVVVEAETFLPRELPEREEERPEPVGETIHLELEFAKEAGYQVLDFFPPEEITFLPEGGFYVSASFPSGRWVIGYLLSYGTLVEVISPSWIREELKAEAEKLFRKYQT